MPGIQYISSNGTLHFHDTNVPTKRICFGQSHRNGLRVATKQESLRLRALVLNQHRSTTSSEAMAPKLVIDLCASDDLDGLPARSETRPDGQPSRKRRKKSHTQSASDSHQAKSHRSQTSLIERADSLSDRIGEASSPRAAGSMTGGAIGTSPARSPVKQLRTVVDASASDPEQVGSSVGKSDRGRKRGKNFQATKSRTKGDYQASEDENPGDLATAGSHPGPAFGEYDAKYFPPPETSITASQSKPKRKRQRDTPTDQVRTTYHQKRKLDIETSHISSAHESVSVSLKHSAKPPTVNRRVRSSTSTGSRIIDLTDDSLARLGGVFIDLVSDEETDKLPSRALEKAPDKSNVTASQRLCETKGSERKAGADVFSRLFRRLPQRSSSPSVSRTGTRSQGTRKGECAIDDPSGEDTPGVDLERPQPDREGERNGNQSVGSSPEAPSPPKTHTIGHGLSEEVRGPSTPVIRETRGLEIAETPCWNSDNVDGGHDEAGSADEAANEHKNNGARPSSGPPGTATENARKHRRSEEDSGYASFALHEVVDADAIPLADYHVALSDGNERSAEGDKQSARASEQTVPQSGQSGTSHYMDTSDSDTIRPQKAATTTIVPEVGGEVVESVETPLLKAEHPGQAQAASDEAEATSTQPVAEASTLDSVDNILRMQFEELRSDNEHWIRACMKRARNSHRQLTVGAMARHNSDGESDRPYSFAGMKPLNLKILPGNSILLAPNALFTTERLATPSVKASKKRIAVTVSGFKTFDTMPGYSHYVHIENSFLAPNVTTMHCWPYFGDESNIEKAPGLKERYYLDIEERRRKVCRLMQAEKYEVYIEGALSELQISWADILRFLYEDMPDVGDNHEAKACLRTRQQSYVEDFTRQTDRRLIVLSSLPASDSQKLAKAALLCENFKRTAKFSLWHIARRHQFDYVTRGTSAARRDLLNALTCSVCLRLDCPYHGELRQQEDDCSDEGSYSTVLDAVAVDIVHPRKVNYRARVAFPPVGDFIDQTSSGQIEGPAGPIMRSNFKTRPNERGPFYPCHHPGASCSQAQCSCFRGNLPCEKTCSCPVECERKFKGCSCALKSNHKGQKATCFRDDRCICYQLNRECDPDLCLACGVREVLEPTDYNDGFQLGRCRNASIQRGDAKHTVLGDSKIHGLGLYAGEPITQHDFVAEYKGEIITRAEGERRGAVHVHQQLSYLFTLNTTQDIDSTNFGDRVRFINHAPPGKTNLYPRVIMIDAVHRIALFAERSIKTGEELFYNYGPDFFNEELGDERIRKHAPQPRNAQLARHESCDVKGSENKQSNDTARKVTNGRGKRSKIVTFSGPAALKARVEAKPSAVRNSKSFGDPGEVPLISETEDGTERGDSAARLPPAADRLTAYNISDDSREGAMELDLADVVVEDDDEDFEPGESAGEESADSDMSEDDLFY